MVEKKRVEGDSESMVGRVFEKDDEFSRLFLDRRHQGMFIGILHNKAGEDERTEVIAYGLDFAMVFDEVNRKSVAEGNGGKLFGLRWASLDSDGKFLCVRSVFLIGGMQGAIGRVLGLTQQESNQLLEAGINA